MFFRSRGFYIVAIVAVWVLIVLVPYLTRQSRNESYTILSSGEEQQSQKTLTVFTESQVKLDKPTQNVKAEKEEPEIEVKREEEEIAAKEQNINTGDIRQGNACLDNMERSEGGQVGTFQCHGEGGNQFWFLTKEHTLRNKDLCLQSPKGSVDGSVLLQKCDSSSQEQLWEYEATMFIQSGTKQCLDSSGTDGVILRKCDVSSVTQKWSF